jgi:hypothetical protein
MTWTSLGASYLSRSHLYTSSSVYEPNNSLASLDRHHTLGHNQRSSEIMRGSLFTLATALTALAIGAKSAQLPLLNQDQHRPKPDPSFPQSGTLRPANLQALGSSIGIGAGGGANLADTLTLERRAGLWWDYARDISAVVRSLHFGV